MYRHENIQPCPYCEGSDGRPKNLYDTEEDAEERAEYQYRKTGTILRVYECPHTDGFHLTKT